MYTTLAKFEKKLKREYAAIYGDENGVVDEELVTDDLNAAAVAIDGKIAGRYSVPVTAPASLPLLDSWNLILAMELAYARSEGTTIPEKIKAAADDVRKQLDAIAEGTGKLPGAAENSSGTGSCVIVSAATPVFTREKMSGF